MSSFAFTPMQIAMALLVSASVVSACSGSAPDDALSPAESEVVGANKINDAADDDGSTTDNVHDTAASIDAIIAEPAATVAAETSNSGVPDPLVQNTLRVDFDITVPAYASNALQVRLISGPKDLAARWVGDEYWTVSDVFPADAELPVSVLFYDGNGDITLANVEVTFRTESNASESYKITADQFDTVRWDEDSDGVSNIDELNAGTNPLLDDSVELEVRKLTPRPAELGLLSGISGSYEWMVPTDRPYYSHTEVNTPLVYEPVVSDGISHALVIDIDEFGTGSVSDKYLRTEPSNRHTENQVATRTNTNNVITWEGTDYWYDSSAHQGEDIDFTLVSKVVDQQTRTQDGVISRDVIGGFAPYLGVAYALTGKVIDDSSRCNPIAGTIEYDGSFLLSTGSVNAKTTISKDIDDQYWNFRVTTSNGHILEEYLVMSLKTTFYCDF